MKRIFLFFPPILLVLVSLACQVAIPNVVTGSGTVDTDTREVSNFDAISLENMGDVYITVGNTEELTIEAEDNLLPLLTSDVENSVLKLDVVRGSNIDPTKPITYNLTVKDLKDITLAGSGAINSAPLEADRMTVMLAGSGNIQLEGVTCTDFKVSIAGSGNIQVDEIVSERIDAEIDGSGDIQLAGEAPIQELDVFGSGSYLAGDLQTETMDINIAGSGNVTVWVMEHLNAAINGSGDISYYGRPTIDHSDNGSGILRSLGEK
ncbi:MAG: head GIN domain-containing protein [Anaerolineales bacterium]|jgi:hypothetical protein